MSDDKILLGVQAFIIFHSFIHLFIPSFCMLTNTRFYLSYLASGAFWELLMRFGQAEKPDISGLTLFLIFCFEEYNIE